MILDDMQQPQPHITLYCSVIFFSLGGKMLRGVELLMIILFSSSLTYLF